MTMTSEIDTVPSSELNNENNDYSAAEESFAKMHLSSPSSFPCIKPESLLATLATTSL